MTFKMFKNPIFIIIIILLFYFKFLFLDYKSKLTIVNYMGGRSVNSTPFLNFKFIFKNKSNKKKSI